MRQKPRHKGKKQQRNLNKKVPGEQPFSYDEIPRPKSAGASLLSGLHPMNVKGGSSKKKGPPSEAYGETSQLEANLSTATIDSSTAVPPTTASSRGSSDAEFSASHGGSDVIDAQPPPEHEEVLPVVVEEEEREVEERAPLLGPKRCTCESS